MLTENGRDSDNVAGKEQMKEMEIRGAAEMLERHRNLQRTERD